MAETVLIRKFADANLQKAVEDVLSRLPADQTFAVVAHADLNGASITAVGKINDNWSLSGSVSKPWNGPLLAEAEVIWSF